jgi:nucleotide-binding universal stress UspA family protein
MFTKLLVAVDLSSRNEDVFTAGLDLARKTGASLMLLHVPSADAPECPTLPTMIGPDYYPLSGTASTIEIYEKLWRAYEEKGLAVLKHFAEKARQAGVEVEYTQTAGAPGKTICHLAHNIDADLILIGRRGHSGLNELVIGSVSNYVMHHASCSVLVVQHGDRLNVHKPKQELAASA